VRNLFFIFFVVISLVGCSDSNSIEIGFWNVENLFDLEDNPQKSDEEFALGGRKMVTQEILDMKLDHLAEVLTDLNVDIIGLCEVENRKVLEMLNEHYVDQDYSIIHYESPDQRGIDTALLYDSTKFKVDESYSIRIPFENEEPSRDILYVKGQFNDQILHLMVNHWPSNYSGLERGMRRRTNAAKIAREQIDKILTENEKANIILMGDFNEDPLARSVKEILNSSIYQEIVFEEDDKLWNPMAHIMGVEGGGTYKYRGVDNVIDQFIVSKGLIDDEELELVPRSVKVMNKDKYRQSEGDFAGYPFRFWVGNNLLGGYSDHMAIHCKLKLKN